MRILCVGNRYPPWSTGGYETTWAAAVQWLRGAGHSVRVLTTLPDPTDSAGEPDPAGAEPDAPDVHRALRWYWRAHRFPSRRLSECRAIERANADVLGRHLRELSPEVVMWWAMGGMSLSLLEQVRRARVPAVADGRRRVAGVRPRGRRLDPALAGVAPVAGPGRRTVNRNSDPAAPRAGGALVVQLRLHAIGRLHGGIGLVDAAIDHPGVAAERFEGAADRSAGDGVWSWRLLYCGRIDPRKGIDTAIRALPLLPPEARLTVHGSGDPDHLAELKALAHQLSVTDQITFSSGPSGQVPVVYAASDVLVFPVRRREPWGLVPLEAMASRRPVVASRSGGGTAEYLEDGGNCLQFEPGDADGLAAALTRLAEHPGLRESLVRSGHATVRRHSETRFHAAIDQRLSETLARGLPENPKTPMNLEFDQEKLSAISNIKQLRKQKICQLWGSNPREVTLSGS